MIYGRQAVGVRGKVAAGAEKVRAAFDIAEAVRPSIPARRRDLDAHAQTCPNIRHVAIVGPRQVTAVPTGLAERPELFVVADGLDGDLLDERPERTGVSGSRGANEDALLASLRSHGSAPSTAG
jgi:hypothetical protein